MHYISRTRIAREGVVCDAESIIRECPSQCDLRTLRHRTPQTASVVSRSFEAQLRGLRLRDCITERTASRRDKRATPGNVRAEAIQPGSMTEAPPQPKSARSRPHTSGCLAD